EVPWGWTRRGAAGRSSGFASPLRRRSPTGHLNHSLTGLLTAINRLLTGRCYADFNLGMGRECPVRRESGRHMNRYVETFFRYWLITLIPIIALPAVEYLQ